MAYTITRATRSGHVLYGFQLADGYRCIPCWHTRRDAVAAALFTITQHQRIRLA